MRDETLTRALARYDASPHLVFWEVTRACALACRHCRASAQPTALPGELTTAEGRALLDSIAAMPGPAPIVVLTGGDCLERPDLFDLIDHARSLGLRLGVAPSVTPRLDGPALDRLFGAGVRALSISLDGAGPIHHDGLRGVPGHFTQTLAAVAAAVERGFRVQVNTTVTAENAGELADVFALVARLGVRIWEVFFLVGVGRGSGLAEVTPDQAEDVCHFLVDAGARGMTVRTVEAPFFRRVQAAREEWRGADVAEGFGLGPLYRALAARLASAPTVPGRRSSATLATGDGRGVVFVGYDGAVRASGFLPVDVGNVREGDLADLYATSPALTAMRRGDLAGPCGACAHRRLCGGSRARAYAATGDELASDPLCVRAAGPYIGVAS